MDEAIVAAGPEVEVTKEQINKMLRNLRNSETIDQAVDAMKALRDEIDMDVKANCRYKDAAEIIVELEGVGTICLALRNWYEQSVGFSRFALESLTSITYFLKEEATIILVRIGGINTILSVAKKHDDDYTVRCNAVPLHC
mmetsp:Transcript_23393/g.35483  ORF Transcript_23393/g.35483 Transcript_23393/m.35483 type:complete len:141 (-) Transcript_23393:160-582(-)